MSNSSLIEQISDYVLKYEPRSELAFDTATLALADTLGCAILSLSYPDCTKLLGPVVKGTIVPNGCHIPGREEITDPVQGAFILGTMIRWLDYNDTFLGAEWAHPSDNIGGILATADYLSRQGSKMTVRDLLKAMIKAYEIQGVLALTNSYNQIGLDHVAFVNIATAAVTTSLFEGTKDQVTSAISNAFIDTAPLRTYRHAPNTGSRKSWAAGEATARGVTRALMAMKGEMGYPNALTAPTFGLYDALFDGTPFMLSRPLACYVMENILFKISFPAEFHAQTAVEAAIELHKELDGRLDEISSIEITTQEPAMRIIDKSGPLKNPADRDHCLQYMVAIGLIFGELNASHYSDKTAKDPRIDAMREKMTVKEEPNYTKQYLDPEMRSITNQVKITLTDGTTLGPKEIHYPLGHKNRRQEAVPSLFNKLTENLNTHYPQERTAEIVDLVKNKEKLWQMPIWMFVDIFV